MSTGMSSMKYKPFMEGTVTICRGFVSSCRSFEPRTLSWMFLRLCTSHPRRVWLFQSLRGESCWAQRDLCYTLEKSY